MSDIATISLRVDTGELVAGNKALDEFQQTATGAAQKADDLNSCFKAGATSQKQSTVNIKEQRQELQNLLNKISPVSRALNDLDDMQTKLRSAQRAGLLPLDDYTDYNQILETTRDKLGRVQQAETAEGRALLEAEAAAARATATRERFIQQLKNQVAVQSLSRTELLRQKAAQLGAGSAAEVYIKKLEQAGEQTRQLGLKSAGARREIGVLIGELARGNLGALRGSGITLANRAGWIDQLLTLRGLGIATVVGGIAGAVIGLGKAWYDGSKESEEFNKQLILTGRYAAQSSAQLTNMAKALSGNGVTQGAAAAALAKTVGTGAFDTSSIQMIADVAARLSTNVGVSVDETINQFKRIQNEPVKAITELDKQYHILGAAQLEQITTLEEQGRKTDAARVAMEAYASGMRDRANDIRENLGVIEAGWRWIKESADSAWDSMLGIGREQTLEEQIEQAKKRASSNISRPSGMNNYGDDQRSLKDLQEEKFQKDIAAARERTDRIEEERKKRIFTDDQKWKREYESAEERHQRRLNEIRNSYASKSAKDLAIQRENDSYAKSQEKKTPKAKAHTDDAATKMLQDSDKRLASLLAQQGVTSQMTAEEKRLVEFNQQIANLKKKDILTADQKSLVARSDEIKASLELEASTSRRIEDQKKLNQLYQQSTRFAEQQAAKRAEIQAKLDGKPEREAGRDAERDRIKTTYAANPEARDRAIKELEATYQKEDELRGSWLAGAKSAWNEYYESATNAYSAVHDVAGAALGGLSGMLDDLVMTGKTSFKSFAASMMKMIVQVIDQLLIAYALQKAMGWVSGYFNPQGGGEGSPSFVGPVQQKWSGGYTGDGGKYEPKGVVHGGEFVFTKEATSAIGVDNLYAMMRGAQGYANGGYVGKAPMAGLKGATSAAGVAPVINTTVNVDAGGGTSSKSSSAGNSMGRALAAEIQNAALQVIQKQVKNGGIIYNFVKGG